MLLSATICGAAGKPASSVADEGQGGPPRTIDDLRAAMRKSTGTPESYAEARAVMRASAPRTDDREELARHYWRRGRAAELLGLFGEHLEAMRLAERYARGQKIHGLNYARVLTHLAVAERRAGNLSRAIQLREQAIERLE